MKEVIFYVTRYEKHFRAVMEHKLLLFSEEKICASIKRLEQAQRRMGELDRLFIRFMRTMWQDASTMNGFP